MLHVWPQEEGMTTPTDFLNDIRLADKTKVRYAWVYQTFERWTGHFIPESDIEVNQFLAHLEELGKSDSTISVSSAALKRVMVYHGIPTNRLEKRSVTMKEPEYLSKDEIRALLDADTSPLVQAIIALLYDTGARITEILGVNMADVDLGTPERGGYFRNVRRKAGRLDTVNVGAFGMGYLQTWLGARTGDHPKVFGDWTYHEIYRFVKTAAKKAGFPFHPHMLRHSRAIHMHDDGMSWEEIGYQLGHVRSSQTINIYGRTKGEDLKAATTPVSL